MRALRAGHPGVGSGARGLRASQRPGEPEQRRRGVAIGALETLTALTAYLDGDDEA